MKESRLWPETDALLGEGEGGCCLLLLDPRSRTLRLFLCRLCLSKTISMLSMRRCGISVSWGSALTGVVGGVPSRRELELARDRERANDADEPTDLELDRKSEPDLGL